MNRPRESSWWAGRGPRRMALGVLAGLLGLGVAVAPVARAGEPPIRIGYMASIFKNRNESDVLAAMRVWAQTMARERNINVDPRMTVVRSLGQAVTAVREDRVDGLTLSLSQYAVFPEGLLAGPFFRDEVNGSALVEYTVVAARNGPVQGIPDLGGARIVIYDGNDADLAQAWLEAQLAASGLERLPAVVGSLEWTEKPSGCVLSVFFDRADACLVRRGIFESTAELNPQVARRLAIVAAAEPIAPSLFCYRADLPRGTREHLLRAALGLHDSVTGKQVLQVFKSDRMQALSAEEVERSVRLLEGWRQAVGDRH